MRRSSKVRGLGVAAAAALSLLAYTANPYAVRAAPARGGDSSTAILSVQRTSKPEQTQGTFVDRVTTQGQRARGLYITYPYLKRFGAAGVATMVKRSRLDAAVIDLKDDQGRISYRTGVDTLKPQVVATPLDLAAEVRALREAGVYTIARIVCFNDPSLPKREPDRAILDGRPKYEGKQHPWVSWGTGDTWLNPYDTRNHELFIAMSREAEALGFDEVQLDYIRFPVDKGTAHARYVPSSEEDRRFVLRDMLLRVDAAISIPLGVDVFGLTTLRKGDPTGLGQSLTDWTAHVEVFSPMLYVNAMPGWRTDVADRGNVLVKGPSYILRQRVGRGPIIRPFMQAFENGLGASFDPAFIAQEIAGARAGDADGFLFWNPGSNYGTVSRAIAVLPFAPTPFPDNGRAAFRAALWARGAHDLSPENERNAAYGW